MKAFTKIIYGITIAAAANPALGAPTAEAKNGTSVATRQAQNGLPDSCAIQGSGALNQWGVYIANNLMPSAQGTGAWGGGFIDNLRGSETAPLDECNPIDWQAIPDQAGTGLAMSFYTTLLCDGNDVASALHAASGVWVICSDNLNEIFDNIAEAGEEIVSLLGDFVGKE